MVLIIIIILAVPKKEEDRRKSVDGGQRGLKNSSSNRLQPIRRNEISEEEALEIVQKLRTRQHQDLLNLLEMEQENEITREELLNNVYNTYNLYSAIQKTRRIN